MFFKMTCPCTSGVGALRQKWLKLNFPYDSGPCKRNDGKKQNMQNKNRTGAHGRGERQGMHGVVV